MVEGEDSEKTRVRKVREKTCSYRRKDNKAGGGVGDAGHGRPARTLTLTLSE